MVDLLKTYCLLEAEKEGIELSLRMRKEQLISEGDIESADAVEDNINSLKRVRECEEEYVENIMQVV